VGLLRQGFMNEVRNWCWEMGEQYKGLWWASGGAPHPLSRG
jgi:hypothetical protein